MGIKTYHKPFRLDSRNGPDIVLGRKDKFVVQHPLSIKTENGRRVQEDVLVILDGEVLVLALRFLLGDLHEEPSTQCTSDVLVVAFVFKRRRDHFQFLAFHDAKELHADIVG